MLLEAAKKLRILYRQKKRSYSLVTILGDLISYKNRIIYLEIKLIQLNIKGRRINVLFNILFLSKDKAVLKMLQLKKYNLKINQAIR